MEEEAKEQSYGVLLYYKYTNIPDVKSTVDFYDTNCRSLGLVGRVRVAPDGVNVTVGGKMESLEKHIEQMKLNPLFDGTDFKLATCDQPQDDKIIRECGFDTLSIRVVKELVTFRSNPLARSPDVSNAGRHLSATEFHSVLRDVMNGGGNEKDIVLLDARNVYETRIGKFDVPNVKTLDPETRQYSDFPSWIDNHSDELQGKSILMYCTGGIRCEMASAYIRSKGTGFENVFQLYGGIQRYLEQFPDGGFFKGKNFVFDHRIAVGGSDDKVVGSCLICDSSFDDYSSRNRCSFCRMLVLVCSECEGTGIKEYKCELCQKTEKRSSLEEVPLEVTPDSIDAPSADHPLDEPSRNRIEPFTEEAPLTNGDLCEHNNWIATDVPFDPLQYMDQTEGFNESCSHLDEMVMQFGPFDGILGFSQGATMVALYCKHKQIRNGFPGFKFGMLFSGYQAPLKDFHEDPIGMPSLHCFGNGHCNKDRQIDRLQSIALRAMFDQGSSMTVEHNMGHIIPTGAPYIDQIKDFISQFT